MDDGIDRYEAQRIAEDERYTAQRYTDRQIEELFNNMHESFVDVRTGLSELRDELMQEIKEIKEQFPERFV